MKALSLSRLVVEGRPVAQPVAFRSDETVITWGTFIGSIEALYSEIASSSDNKWLLSCPDALEFLIALLAVWHAGRTPIIPANYQKESISAASKLSDKIIDHVQVSPSKPGKVRFNALDPKISKLILYTSGSTGVPKAVEKTLFQLDSEVLALEAQWGAYLKESPVVATVPYHHIYGLLFRLLWPIAAGRIFVADEMTMPDVLFSCIKKIGPVVLISSPSHITRMPALVDLNNIAPYIAHIFSSGAPLPEKTSALYAEKIGISPVEVYGSTETGGVAWKKGSLFWTPFSTVEVRVADEGALEVRSPYTFNQEWIRTGDRAEVDEKGHFYLAGRLDRIAKVEGKRVSLDEMIARLNEHPWVSSAGIVPLAGTRSTLGAVIVLSREGLEQFDNIKKHLMAASLKSHLAQWFEPVVIPRRWRFVRVLPTNDRGKITESGLAAFFGGSLLEPIILSVEKKANGLTLAMLVPAKLLQFKGHFPEFPVLPGVVQVHWAALFGMREFNIAEPFRRISKLKFHRVILPDTELTLQIGWDDNKLDFTYSTPEGIHSSGRLEFRS